MSKHILSISNTKQLCKFIEERVGRPQIQQLQCSNGAFISSLTEFLDDHPEAIEELVGFIEEVYPEPEEEDFEDGEPDE